MKELTRAERYEVAANAISSIELEGLSFTDDEIEIIARYVDGEMSLDEASELLRSLP